MLENITANEVAGYCVGALLLCSTISAPKIDTFIAASQHRSVGMCRRCGDLGLITCSKCKGTGSINAGDPFHFNPPDGDGVFQSKGSSICCPKCQAEDIFPAQLVLNRPNHDHTVNI